MRIAFDPPPGERVYEVPGDKPIREFILDVIKSSTTIEDSVAAESRAELWTARGTSLDFSSSLQQQGVVNFDQLTLVLDRSDSFEVANVKNQDKANAPDPDATIPGLFHKNPAIPGKKDQPSNMDADWAQNWIERPSLVSRYGYIFEIRDPQFRIGREDPERNSYPDLDLTELEEKFLSVTSFISSRVHAEIVREKKKYLLYAYDTANGTFLNGEYVTTGKNVPLSDSDLITFGQGGIELAFRLPDVDEGLKNL